MFKPFPFYPQLESMDCGPACLKMIAKYYGRKVPLIYLRKKCNITKYGISMEDLSIAAKSLGFKTMPVSIDFDFLETKQPLPCIVHWRNEHFLVIYRINKKKVYVMDPSYGKIKYSKNEFINKWQESSKKKSEGYALLFEPTNKLLSFKSEIKTESYRKILKHISGLKKYLLRLLISVVLTSLIQLVFPILTQHIVDFGIGNKNMSFIYLILLAQLILYVSEMTLGLIRSWITLYLNSKISISYISDYLTKLLKLPIVFYDSKNAGDILQRVGDFKKIHNFFSSTLVQIVLSFLNMLLFGFLLFKYSFKIFLVFLLGSIVYVLWTSIFLEKRSLLDYERFGKESKNQDILIQLVSGIEEIKLNGSERRRRWQWEENEVELLNISERGLRLSQIQNTGGVFINEIKNLIIIFIASQQVIESNLSLGVFVSIQYIIGQLNVPVKEFVSFIQLAQDAKNSFDRLSEIDSWEEEAYSSQPIILNDNKSIRIKDLSFSYGFNNKKNRVLNRLNLEIKEGETTAIVGDSGSGKTTLLKLLSKLYLPTSGDILIEGVSLKDYNSYNWRTSCGVVMQDGYIFNDTILKNITESEQTENINLDKLKKAVNVSNLNEVIKILPKGIDTSIGATGINLSGGQKQRILIARAIYKDPNYLFLDEATSSLDSINEKSIVGKITEFFKSKTIVVVAHRLSTVKNADKIIVLKDGRIIETGNHDSLLKRKGHYYKLIKNQLMN